MPRRFVPLLAALVFSCGGGSGGPRAGLYDVVNAFPALSFANPLVLTHAPGDATRLFVAEQRGTIQVFPNDSATATTGVFLDIQSKVEAGGEKGLLGLAFDPAYATNGYFYVYYSAPGGGGDHRSIVARYQVTADPDVADPSSETILLEFDQPYGNHNGGCLAFGPDGHLYIASGDGGSGGDPQNNGQSLATVLGKILRITSTGAIPADNPFVGTGGARGEIWAYGLRNPWRFSFDRLTGDLWCGDVGQNEIEEIDVITGGGNYGWRLFEGERTYNNPLGVDIATTARPVVTYTHAVGASVTGGYVYRGAALPGLVGSYIYGDFGSGRLWALVWNGASVVSNVEIAGVPAPASFGEDFAGEIYICSFDGSIYRLAELP